MQFHWSESDLRGQDESCEALAPYVMALFDGEANEEQARRARAHLLLCQSCAHRWLDWNRSRDLLRSVPVPAPPPTMMWRILMACRLADFAKRGTSKTTAAPQPTFSRESGAPDALAAQILARTTRTAPQSQVMKSRRNFNFLAVPSMAVPALALWLMVLQRNTFMTASMSGPSEATQSLVSDTPERDMAEPQFNNLVAVTPHPHKKVVVRSVAPRSAAPAVTETADEPEPRANVEHVAREARAEIKTPRIVPVSTSVVRSQNEERDERPEVQPQVSEVEAPPIVRTVAVTTPPVAPPRLRTTTPQLRPATLSDTGVMPRMHTALATPRVAKFIETSADSPQPLRVAVPSSSAVPTPAPRLADNFDSDDTRVDEMRSVVDDFRAALAPDVSSSDSMSDDSAG